MTDHRKALASIARQLRTVLARREAIMQAAKEAAIRAHDEGIPETEIAKTLGVNRMTVRRWLGK